MSLNPTPRIAYDRHRPIHLAALESHNGSIIQFVTVCTSNRRHLLAHPVIHQMLRRAWRTATWYSVGRYVIMPDHVHLFCSPAIYPPESLAKWVNYWKSLTACEWINHAPTRLWQRNFWDRQLRNSESYSEKWEYVKNNPVRAGLVMRPEDWELQGEMNVLRWHD